MARVNLDIQDVVVDGLEAEYEAIDDTDGIEFANAGKCVLHLVNTDAGEPAEITIITTYAPEGLEVENRVINLAAEEEVFVGPFNPRYYNTPAGKVQVDTDNDEVEAAVLRLP